MSSTTKARRIKIAGCIIVVIVVGWLLVASGDTGSEQDVTLEEQVASCQTKLASLEQLLGEIRQTNLVQWAGLQSRVEQMNVDQLSQATAVESRFNQTTEDYLTRISELQRQLNDIHEEHLQAVEGQEPKRTALLRIAHLDTESAFSVFTNAVSDLRQKAIDKQGEIVKLQQQYMAGTISKDDFDNQNNQLQMELLQAQFNIDLGTIDKMIASSGFSDMKSDLQRLKDEAQPVADEMKNLVSTVRVGVIDTTEFQNRYTQVKNAFTQLDQLLTNAATAKIMQAAATVAIDGGYDLVLRTKNVIVYRNTGKLTDITDLVKHEIELYL